MTDSVNWETLEDSAARSAGADVATLGLFMGIDYRSKGPRSQSAGESVVAVGSGIAFAVKAAVNLGVAQHDLDVIARLGERDGVDEFGRFGEVLAGFPGGHMILARIVGGQRSFGVAPVFLELGQVNRAETKIVGRVGEACAGIADALL